MLMPVDYNDGKLYNADNRVVYPHLNPSSIDLIVTSPPYNVGINYDAWDDEMPWEEYLDFMREQFVWWKSF